MNKFELQQRTQKFHVEIIKLCENFPKNAAGFETAKQLIKSGRVSVANLKLHAEENQKPIL